MGLAVDGIQGFKPLTDGLAEEYLQLLSRVRRKYVPKRCRRRGVGRPYHEIEGVGNVKM